VLSAFLDSLQHGAKHSQHRLPHLVGNLASRVINILIITKQFPAPQAPQPKDTHPAVIHQEHNTIDRPGLDSHHVQVEFPEILVRINLDTLFADHLIPDVIVLVVLDRFVGRE
jgi:hypothetical protein